MEIRNQQYYYLFDGLGSVTQITDTSGNVVNNYVYDSFGNIVKKSEIVRNFYTYTGREYDSESGLYYYRMRYYDAKSGRFLQTYGPIESAFLTPGKNRYVYVRNNPINEIDPIGWGSVGPVIVIPGGEEYHKCIEEAKKKYERDKEACKIALGVCGEGCKQPWCSPWGGIDPSAPMREAMCQIECMAKYTACMARAAARFGKARARCELYKPRLPSPRPMPIPGPPR